MNIKIKTDHELSVPSGTKVITNDEWLTLARKNKTGHYEIITVPIHEIGSTDFNNENAWIELRKEELKQILSTIK